LSMPPGLNIPVGCLYDHFFASFYLRPENQKIGVKSTMKLCNCRLSVCATSLLIILFFAPIYHTVALAESPEITEESIAEGEQQRRQLSNRLSLLIRELIALEELIDGRVSNRLRLSELFSFDLKDREAVENKLEIFKNSVTPKIAALRDLGWDGEYDPFALQVTPTSVPEGESEEEGETEPPGEMQIERSLVREIKLPEPTLINVGLVELRVTRLRIQFLSLPEQRITEIERAEAEEIRLIEEQARANEERRAAAEQARKAAEARRIALEKAEAARNETERSIARERAALEGVRAQLAEYRTSLAHKRELFVKGQNERRESITQLLQTTAENAAASREADALYDDLVSRLNVSRTELGTVLRNYRQSPTATRYSGNLSELAPQDVTQTTEVDFLNELQKELDQLAVETEGEVLDLNWQSVGAAADHADRLNDMRLALLEQVSEQKRESLLGIGPEGIGQLVRELHHSRLYYRWLKLAGKRLALEKIESMRDPYRAGVLLTKFLIVICFLVIYILIIRRGRKTLNQLQGLISSTIKTPLLVIRIESLFRWIDRLFGEFVFLLAVLIAPSVLGFTTDEQVLGMIYYLALWYAGYRLVIAALLRTLERIIGESQREGETPRSVRLLHSVRLAGRYVLAVAFILIVSSTVLGKGYLHGLVKALSWVGAIPIAVILIRRWRADIANEYLRLRESGPLADAVRQSRDRWFGFFVAVLAFVALVVDGVTRGVRRFVLGFEHSQKLLAYIFRKRLEFYAREIETEQEESQLSVDLVSYLEDRPIDDEMYKMQRFPLFDKFESTFNEWLAGGKIGATLLVGNSGYGKTSWLNNVARRIPDIEKVSIKLTRRITSTDDALRELGRGLNAPDEVLHSAEALGQWVRTGEPRLVLIDDLHLWFTRGLNTLGPWDIFNRVVDEADDRIYWVASFAYYPYQFLNWIRRGNDVFRQAIVLQRWSEEEINSLITTRMGFARYDIHFEDLLLSAESATGATSRVLSTARDYNRLVWDYSLGSPRAALHCWRQSLVPDEERSVRVRLFKYPRAETLERISETEKFVLACVVWHEKIGQDDVSASLRIPLGSCDNALSRLAELGILEIQDGMFRVAIGWWTPAIRYLRRKNLIES
jgi:hypothetical protein